ncbi:ABC transporter ATP-binding protein [Terrilactibacillus laevilacticus]|uniref:ABC transporter ATP-binding protein n=1 Tax=Terrilactibacillus laevilacticus TaxID=1380157 RepID=A0ABW5PMZ0_9BACI|nr:ABC transporter ATP-binding protein [Terrilactibacillus laevilacticus]
MIETIIKCEHATKKFGDRFALNDLNLEIPKGKVIGILGENGVGKSTLFRVLVGLTRLDQGKITVLGEQPNIKLNANIAYLPDRASWYQDQTVRKAFEFGVKLLPHFNIERAKQFASLMNLDLDMKVSSMSKGQESRLMLTMCMSRNVPLIILDEPFSGIDGTSREHIIESMIDYMSDREVTILMTTHEIYEAEGLLDYAIFLDKGHVLIADEAENLRREHGSLHDLSRKLYR